MLQHVAKPIAIALGVMMDMGYLIFTVFVSSFDVCSTYCHLLLSIEGSMCMQTMPKILMNQVSCAWLRLAMAKLSDYVQWMLACSRDHPFILA